jgi:pimeloyl-ACP methyl ester carboxylesterase
VVLNLFGVPQRSVSDSRFPDSSVNRVLEVPPRRRDIAPDLLGHGESEKPTGDYSLGAHASFVRDLLRALGIGRVTAVGHSFGGGIVLQLSYQHPELCERIVLESSGGLAREVNAVLRLLSVPGAELVLPVIAPSFVRKLGDALVAWIRRQGIRAPRMHEGWLAYSALADPDARRAFVRELRSVVEFGGQVVSAKDRIRAATGLTRYRGTRPRMASFQVTELAAMPWTRRMAWPRPSMRYARSWPFTDTWRRSNIRSCKLSRGCVTPPRWAAPAGGRGAFTWWIKQSSSLRPAMRRAGTACR